MKNKYFYLYTNVVPVRGFKRSIICDLERGKYDFIPNDLFDIVKKFNGKKINSIFDKFKKDNYVVVLEYFNFLVKKEYIYLSDNKIGISNNKKIEFEHPNSLLNAIIDVNINSNYNFNNFIKQISELNCHYLQIRFYGLVDKLKILEILNYTKSTNLRFIQIIIKKNIFSNKKLYDLILKHPRIRSIIVFGCKVSLSKDIYESKIHYTKDIITSCNQCGIIDSDLFSVNIDNYRLSKNYNSCLYKKISIDVNGKVKNCPSMLENYGSINKISIEKIIKTENFKKFDKITKDQIKVCKDCEFRYICTDCRVFVEGNIHSKPLKCNYNPYKTKWEI